MKKFTKAVSVLAAAAMAVSSMAGVAYAEDATFKFGGIGPLTGAAAIYGTSAMNGAQMAVDEINAAGGINGYQVEFNPQDDEHDAEKSVNAYNTLKDWGMQALIGSVTTTPCVAVAYECANDNIFALTPSASSTEVTAAGAGNVYQLCFTDPGQGQKSAQYITENMPDITKVAVIYNSSDAYSTGIYETFVAEAESAPFEVVETQTFTDDSNTDFSAQIQACMDAEAELVFLPFYYTEASIVLKQANEKGYAPTWFGVDGMDGILGVEGFDTSLAEGVLLLTPFVADAEDEQVQTFTAAYEEAFGETPTQFAADGYDCVYSLKAALEQAGATADMSASDIADALKAAFQEIEVDGVTGTMTWNESGEVTKEPQAMVIKDGAYTAYEG